MILALCALVPSIILFGMCTLEILESISVRIGIGEKKESTYDLSLILPLGFLVLIGISFVANLSGLVFGGNFSVATLAFLLMIVALTLLCAVFAYFAIIKKKKYAKLSNSERSSARDNIILLASAVLFLLLIVLGIRCGLDDSADILPETVITTLSSGSLYSTNPMTGNVYQSGVPSRIKILCLPFLYSALCKVGGMEAYEFLNGSVRAFVALVSMCAFYSFANAAFSTRREKRAFILFVLLILLGTSADGTLGGGLISAPGSAMTIRNMIILPVAFTAMMKRKYVYIIPAALAELACCWTLYGLGMVVFATVVFAIVDKVAKKGTFAWYTFVMMILTLTPIKALLEIYQTKFYATRDMFCLIPVVMLAAGVLTYLSVTVLPKQSIQNYVLIIAITVIAYGAVAYNTSVDFKTQKKDLSAISMAIEELNLGNVTFAMPMEEAKNIRYFAPDLKLLYGRDLYIARLQGYTFDAYPEEYRELAALVDSAVSVSQLYFEYYDLGNDLTGRNLNHTDFILQGDELLVKMSELGAGALVLPASIESTDIEKAADTAGFAYAFAGDYVILYQK